MSRTTNGDEVIKIVRKSKKRVVVKEPMANEINIEVAVPLTMDESLYGNQRVDAVAEPDEVVAIMTEEDCLMAEAELMMKRADELRKEAQRRIAEKRIRDNVGELREKVLLPKRELSERLRDEILRKQLELGKLVTEIEDIEEGVKDDELIEEAIELANRVAERPVKRNGEKKTRCERVKQRLPLDEVLRVGDSVFLKSQPHLSVIWDGRQFKNSQNMNFTNLNQVNIYHQRTILGKKNEPNAWLVYRLRRANGDVCDLDDVFLV